MKELANHLVQHKAPNAVSIGEDATRIIARIEWDAETNHCYGFVLPLNKDGLLKSILSWQYHLKEWKIMFLIIVYVNMAQPLLECCPSFCLMLIGTDIKFKTLRGGNISFKGARKKVSKL